MNERLRKYIEAIPWLISNPYVSVKDFAEHFGFTKKQALEALKTLTFVGPGQGGGQLVDIRYDDGDIVVIDPQGLDRPIRFNRSEAFALLSGLTYIKVFSDDQQRVAIEELITNIAEIAGVTDHVFDVVGHPIDTEILQTVQSAISRHSALAIVYSSGTGEVTHRIVEPQRLETVNDVVYVVTWCQLSSAARSFRLDRILEAQGSDAPSTNTAGIQAKLDDAVGEKVAVVATPEALELFRGPHIVSQEGLPDGRVKAILQVGSLDWMAGQVLASAGQIEVLEPTSLRRLVLEKAQQWLASNS